MWEKSILVGLAVLWSSGSIFIWFLCEKIRKPLYYDNLCEKSQGAYSTGGLSGSLSSQSHPAGILIDRCHHDHRRCHHHHQHHNHLRLVRSEIVLVNLQLDEVLPKRVPQITADAVVTEEVLKTGHLQMLENAIKSKKKKKNEWWKS